MRFQKPAQFAHGFQPRWGGFAALPLGYGLLADAHGVGYVVLG